jgi:hypothetical protein
MRVISLVALTVIVALPGSAHAQMKFSGRCVSQKPDPAYTAQVGDRNGHMLLLAKQKCTWENGELGGLTLKQEEDTFTSDISGASSRDHGYGVGTASNGDKYFVRFDGSSTMKNNMPATLKCTWTFTGGTGKLNGITGKGTCSGAMNPDGTGTVTVEGEYQLASKTSTQ